MLLFEPFVLYVQTLCGQTYPVRCFGRQNTIEYVKFVLHQTSGMQPNRMRLLLNERVLQDYNTLEHYNIHENSRITLVPALSCGR